MALPGQVTLNAPAILRNPMAGINLATRNAMLSNQMLSDTIGEVGSTYAKAQERGKEEAGKRTTADIIAQISSMGTDIASARALENNPMFSEANILGSYDYGSNVDMGAINEAISGNVATRRNEVIDSVMGSADQIASDTGSVAAGAENMRQSLIDSGVSGTEANKAANTYSTNREQTQNLFDQQNLQNTESLRREFGDDLSDPENMSHIIDAGEIEFGKRFNSKQLRADAEKIRDGAYKNKVRNESLTEFERSQASGKIAELQAKQLTQQNLYDDAVIQASAQVEQFNLGISEEEITDALNNPKGLAGYIASVTKHKDNDITDVIKVLESKGYSKQDAARLFLGAYKKSGFTHDADSTLGLWGLMGLNRSVLDKDLNLMEGELKTYHQAVSARNQAKLDSSRYATESAIELAQAGPAYTDAFVTSHKTGNPVDYNKADTRFGLTGEGLQGILRTAQIDSAPQESALDKQKRIARERAEATGTPTSEPVPTPQDVASQIMTPEYTRDTITAGEIGDWASGIFSSPRTPVRASLSAGDQQKLVTRLDTIKSKKDALRLMYNTKDALEQQFLQKLIQTKYK